MYSLAPLFDRRPVITGNNYSDLISSAAYHFRMALDLYAMFDAGKGTWALRAANNHARAAESDRDFAARLINPRRDLDGYTCVESGMPEFTEKVAGALDAAGYKAMWAKNKGGGFWIEGLGYHSLKACAALVNVKPRPYHK